MQERYYLDPLNEKISSLSYTNEQQVLISKAADLSAHPFAIKILFGASCLIPLSLLIFMGIQHLFVPQIFIISFIPVVTYYHHIKNLQNELMQHLLCKENNWAFNPARDTSRVELLASVFPAVFDRGETRRLRDQIWGNINNANSMDFWSAKFQYDVPEEKNQKYDQTVFIMNLATLFPIVFSLFCYGQKSELKTESEEFNKIFHIRADNENTSKKVEIFKLLSPSVQVRLIDFSRKYSVDCITFQSNCLSILFSTNPWKSNYTNFFKSVTIDERDVKAYYSIVRDIVDLTEEIKKFID